MVNTNQPLPSTIGPGGAPPPWPRSQDGKTPEGAARIAKIRLESSRLPPQ